MIIHVQACKPAFSRAERRLREEESERVSFFLPFRAAPIFSLVGNFIQLGRGASYEMRTFVYATQKECRFLARSSERVKAYKFRKRRRALRRASGPLSSTSSHNVWISSLFFVTESRWRDARRARGKLSGASRL